MYCLLVVMLSVFVFDVLYYSGGLVGCAKFYPYTIKQVSGSYLLLGRNVRWPRRMLPPGESR